MSKEEVAGVILDKVAGKDRIDGRQRSYCLLGRYSAPPGLFVNICHTNDVRRSKTAYILLIDGRQLYSEL